MFTISSHSRRLRSERRTGAELIGQGGQFYRIRARHFSTAQESPRYRSEPRSTQMITLSARTRACCSAMPWAPQPELTKGAEVVRASGRGPAATVLNLAAWEVHPRGRLEGGKETQGQAAR
jgi:hypothetical protein